MSKTKNSSDGTQKPKVEKVKKAVDPNAPPKPKVTTVLKRNISAYVTRVRGNFRDLNPNTKITLEKSIIHELAKFTDAYMRVLIQRVSRATTDLKGSPRIIHSDAINIADLSGSLKEACKRYGKVPVIKRVRDPSKPIKPHPIVSRKKIDEFIANNPNATAADLIKSISA